MYRMLFELFLAIALAETPCMQLLIDIVEQLFHEEMYLALEY